MLLMALHTLGIGLYSSRSTNKGQLKQDAWVPSSLSTEFLFSCILNFQISSIFHQVDNVRQAIEDPKMDIAPQMRWVESWNPSAYHGSFLANCEGSCTLGDLSVLFAVCRFFAECQSLQVPDGKTPRFLGMHGVRCKCVCVSLSWVGCCDGGFVALGHVGPVCLQDLTTSRESRKLLQTLPGSWFTSA